MSAQGIRTTSGLHEASFGEESNEKSGIALARKQNQAQIVTYNFPDNMSKAAKRTGEIILDRTAFEQSFAGKALGVVGDALNAGYTAVEKAATSGTTSQSALRPHAISPL